MHVLMCMHPVELMRKRTMQSCSVAPGAAWPVPEMHRLAVLSSACVALVAALPNGVGLLPEYVRKLVYP